MGGPGGPFGGGPFGATTGNQPARLSLEIQGKDLSFAVLAFDRYAQARVVPEDGTAATINLTLQQAPVPDAVAQLAKKAHRSWTTLYALRGGGFGPDGRGGPGFSAGFRDPGGRGPTDGPGGSPQFAARGPDGADRRGPGGRDVTDEQWEEMRKQRATLEEELKQALPVAERQKLEQAQAEREQMMQEMQSLTPEQRMQRFSQMGGGNMDKMNRDRILNSTPEQRARMGPGGPGRGGPGGPPR